ncbi:MAG: hypothetical protein WC707_07115 [Candidatus Babeliaceae bacterium]|jgi:hypothetical protein
MLIDETVEIGNNLEFNAHYLDGMTVDVALIDFNEEFKIDKDKAIEIIAFLQKHFGV